MNFNLNWMRRKAPPLPQAVYFDDFCENVDQLRALALGARYETPGGAFMGCEARSNAIDIKVTMNRIAALLGEPIYFIEKNQGVFRTLSADQERKKIRHVHVDRMGFAGVLCLNPQDGGSTAFYRHVLTGVAHVDAIRPTARQLGIRNAELCRLLYLDGADLGKWERVCSIDYRYNRLIIFDADYFHVASSGRGDALPEMKMTQNFNFYFGSQLGLRERLAHLSKSR